MCTFRIEIGTVRLATGLVGAARAAAEAITYACRDFTRVLTAHLALVGHQAVVPSLPWCLVQPTQDSTLAFLGSIKERKHSI